MDKSKFSKGQIIGLTCLVVTSLLIICSACLYLTIPTLQRAVKDAYLQSNIDCKQEVLARGDSHETYSECDEKFPI